MIRHCVFCAIKPDHDAAELASVMAGLADLCARLDGAKGFVAGPNRDFERKSQDYATGLTIDFDDASALSVYADHPEHKALGARLVAQCVGEADGLVVFDLDV